MIKAIGDIAGEFNMLSLVFADGDMRSPDAGQQGSTASQRLKYPDL